MKSPTELTLRYLRRSGYVVGVTEYWFQMGEMEHGRRRDLFGFVDIIALMDGQSLWIQTTSTGGMSARVHKILGTDTPPKDVRDDEKKLAKHRAAQFDRKRAAREIIKIPDAQLVVYGFDKGMKVPQMRYITEHDFVDQDELFS